MLRSIISVVVGWLVYGISVGIFFALTGIDPHGETSIFFKIGSTVFGIVFSFLGGYVTTLIAKKKLFIHSVMLSLLLILIAIGFMNLTSGSHWSEWINIFVIAPSAAIGGWIRVKNMNK